MSARTVGSLVAAVATIALSCTGAAPSTDRPDAQTSVPSGEAVASRSPDPTGPRARAYSLMADDVGDRILVYGGQYGVPPGTGLSDVWSWSPGSGWTLIDPGRGDVHGGDGFVLVPDVGAVVNVEAERTRLLDVVEYRWRTPSIARHPTHVWGTRFVYVPDHGLSLRSGSGAVVGFGGFDGTSLYGDTWVFDVGRERWTRTHPDPSPPPENFHAMAYAPTTAQVILFNAHGQTWGYDVVERAWTNLRPADAPDGRIYAGMAWDPVGERVIMFGGVTDGTEEPFGDTWAYDPRENTWTELDTPTAPSPRGWHAMATDADSGSIYVFGGGETRDTALADLWRFDGGTDGWIRVG
jgi:hypothetical protein